MKALTLTQYGSPDYLTITDIPTPAPSANQVLINVHAASVNDWDWCIVNGQPFYIRLLCGLRKPNIPVLGVDVAGEVVAVGEAVTRYKVGDEVYGDLSDNDFGAFGEYVCAPESAIAPKPKNFTYVQAAALPHAGMLAWQGLSQAGIDLSVFPSLDEAAQVDEMTHERNRAKHILINGAGGGMGTLAIQIAKAAGVGTITGVDSAEKLSTLTELGCTAAMDFNEVDFTLHKGAFDAILDPKSNRSIPRCAQSLAERGRYITVGGLTKYLLQTILCAAWTRQMHNKTVAVLALKPNAGLEKLTQLCEAGRLTPVVDGPYPFGQAVEAIRRFGSGCHKGKVVIAFD